MRFKPIAAGLVGLAAAALLAAGGFALADTNSGTRSLGARSLNPASSFNLACPNYLTNVGVWRQRQDGDMCTRSDHNDDRRADDGHDSPADDDHESADADTHTDPVPGPARPGGHGCPAHTDGNAAKWWQLHEPLLLDQRCHGNDEHGPQ